MERHFSAVYRRKSCAAGAVARQAKYGSFVIFNFVGARELAYAELPAPAGSG